MQVREFNKEGIEAFRRFLEECRVSEKNGEISTRQELKPERLKLLQDEKLSSKVQPVCEVADVSFTTKGEAAASLQKMLKKIPESELVKNVGLWSWLSLRYFDLIRSEGGKVRSINNDYYYILDINSRFYFHYRHLLFVSWTILNIAPEHNRLMLSTPVSTLGGVTIEIMKRQHLRRIPYIFELLDKLYWDESRGQARKGTTGKGRGSLTERLPMRIQQLEMTYDLQGMSADNLIELLGEEFQLAGPKAV